MSHGVCCEHSPVNSASNECSRDRLHSALALIEEEYKRFPSGEELVVKLSKKFTDTFDHPPIFEFERLLGSPVSPGIVREALFDPTRDEHVALYPSLLDARTEGSEKFHSLILAFLFLIHRKQWNFMSKFILFDGLRSVATLINGENLYLKGQAVEILLSATDCDQFDWFLPPKNTLQSQLHNKMLNLNKDGGLLLSLVANRRQSYPGGSMRCLQILAFWLSWVRAEYSDGQILYLSRTLLDELEKWASKEFMVDAADEEIELATTLVKDFGRERTAELLPDYSATDIFVEGIDQIKCAALLTKTFPEENEASHNSTGPLIESSLNSVDTVNDLKERANTAYKIGNFTEALRLYEETIDLHKESEEDTESWKQIAATLYFNKASALWKISQTSSLHRQDKLNMVEIDDDMFDDTILSDKLFELQRCEQSCLSALSLVPLHLKAFFRLISVMLAMGRPEEALHKLKEAQLSLQSEDKSFETVLSDLSCKCNASLILRNGVKPSRDPDIMMASILTSGATLTTKAAKVLARLNLRRIRESENCAHAWTDWQPPIENNESKSSALSPDMTNNSAVMSVDSDEDTTLLQALSNEGSASKNHDAIIDRGNHAKLSSADTVKGKNKTADTEKAIAKSKKEQFMRMMKSL